MILLPSVVPQVSVLISENIAKGNLEFLRCMAPWWGEWVLKLGVSKRNTWCQVVVKNHLPTTILLHPALTQVPHFDKPSLHLGLPLPEWFDLGDDDLANFPSTPL